MGGERMSWQAQLLTAVHETPGITRAAAARQLGMSSGLATETTARLVSAGLVAERPLPPAGHAAGSRTRPRRPFFMIVTDLSTGCRTSRDS